jgi:hypothetical protein
MYTDFGLKQRLSIIHAASISDAVILDENYHHLIKESIDSAEKYQFISPYFIVKEQINKLKGIIFKYD